MKIVLGKGCVKAFTGNNFMWKQISIFASLSSLCDLRRNSGNEKNPTPVVLVSKTHAVVGLWNWPEGLEWTCDLQSYLSACDSSLITWLTGLTLPAVGNRCWHLVTQQDISQVQDSSLKKKKKGSHHPFNQAILCKILTLFHNKVLNLSADHRWQHWPCVTWRTQDSPVSLCKWIRYTSS